MIGTEMSVIKKEQGKTGNRIKRKNWKNIVVILVITMLLLFLLICCCENEASAKYIRQIDVVDLTVTVYRLPVNSNDLTLEVSMGLS